MHLIYDHLIASILGVAVFFILVAVQVRGGETARDQTRYYSAKTHLLQVTQMLEHDLTNVGAGVAAEDPVFLTKDEDTLEFMALVDSEDEAPSKITYLRIPTEVVEIGGEAVQLYEIHRLVDDVLTGRGPATMRAFEIALWDSNRQETTDFNAVETIHVEFVIASPLGGDDGLHAARWNRTFRPANLSTF